MGACNGQAASDQVLLRGGTGSFIGASELLGNPPSVVSKSIANLEGQLGASLFHRTTRRVVITEAGANYYDLCKRLVDELDRAEESVREGRVATRGQLVVGVHPSLIRPLLGRLSEFSASYPELTIETNLGSTVATILEDKIDVLLTLGNPPDSTTLGVSQLGTTQHILVASPEYLKRRGALSQPDDLVRHDIIASARTDGPTYSRWTLFRGDERQIVFVNPKLINRQGIYMQDACLAGVGVARLATVAADGFLKDGRLIRVLPDWDLGSFPISAVYPSHRSIPKRTKVFVDFARKMLR